MNSYQGGLSFSALTSRFSGIVDVRAVFGASQNRDVDSGVDRLWESPSGL